MEATMIIGYLGIMEKKMEATGNNRLYWDNGKENGSYR